RRLELARRRRRLALAQQQRAEVVVRLGKVGLAHDGRPVRGFGLGALALLLERDAAQVVRPGIGGGGRRGGPPRAPRTPDVAAPSNARKAPATSPCLKSCVPFSSSGVAGLGLPGPPGAASPGPSRAASARVWRRGTLVIIIMAPRSWLRARQRRAQRLAQRRH